MNDDAYAHVMQVQLCKANTWGVTKQEFSFELDQTGLTF
jgi:hypothetical protein